MPKTTEVYFKVEPVEGADPERYQARVLPQSIGRFPMGTREVQYVGPTANDASDRLQRQVRKTLSPDRVRFIEAGR